MTITSASDRLTPEGKPVIGLSAPIPILRIFSEEAAHAFHLDFPGFQVGRQMQIADPFGNRIRFCELSA